MELKHFNDRKKQLAIWTIGGVLFVIFTFLLSVSCLLSYGNIFAVRFLNREGIRLCSIHTIRMFSERLTSIIRRMR